MSKRKQTARKRAARRRVGHVKVSKLVAESYSVSFALSGRANCHPSCRVLSHCYAQPLEAMYKGLQRKLVANYAAGALFVARRARQEIIDGPPIVWARFSVDGSLPPRAKFTRRRWLQFTSELRSTVVAGLHRGATWHIPVESPGKARSYRAALQGLPVVVRRTSQARTAAEVIRQGDHRAWIVGDVSQRRVSAARKARNIAEAYAVAKQARAAGVSAVVCPAVAGASKCGKCRACGDKLVQLILYPHHN